MSRAAEAGAGHTAERLKLGLVAGAALAVAGVMLAGWLWPPYSSHGLYGDIDGQWARLNAMATMAWGGALDFSAYNPLAGLGTVFPPNLPGVNPGALLLLLPDPELAGLLSYLWYVLVLSGSIWLLGATLALPAHVRLLACLAHVAVLFPPFDGLFQAANWYSAAPFYAQLTAALNLALACLIRAGRAPLPRAAAWGLGFLACAALAFATAPFTSLVFAPFYAAMALACLFEPRTRPGRHPAAVRAACGLAAVALFLASGAAEHILATAAASARLPAPPEVGPGGWLANAVASFGIVYAGGDLCWRPGESLCPNRGYAWLQLLALAGALAWAWHGRGHGRGHGGERDGADPLRRPLGIAFALFYLAFLLYTPLYAEDMLGVVSVYSSGFMIWSSYGVAALLAAALLDRLAGPLLQPLAARLAGLSPLPRRALPPAAGFALAAVLLLAAHLVLRPLAVPGGDRAAVDRGRGNALVDAVAAEIALRPGDRFAGRAASLLGGPTYIEGDEGRAAADRPGHAAAWRTPLGWVAGLQGHRRATGNRFWGADLWERGIPTLGEYGQWSTPLAHAVIDALLHTPHTEQGPNYVVASRFRPGLLQLFGVAVVIADTELAAPGLQVIAEMPSTGGTIVRAYRLPHPNLGQVSPRRVATVTGLAELRRRLGDPAADLAGTVFVRAGSAVPARDWQPASAARLEMRRDGFRISATAPGPALLLLPVQYSACLAVDAAQSPSPPLWTGRGDGLLTLVAFEARLEAVLAFRFGPEPLSRPRGDAACRRMDGAEMRAWLADGQDPFGASPEGIPAGGIPADGGGGYAPTGREDSAASRSNEGDR